jgi:hypothetical protein
VGGCAPTSDALDEQLVVLDQRMNAALPSSPERVQLDLLLILLGMMTVCVGSPGVMLSGSAVGCGEAGARW